jgi:cis-3-alkyl-4-acyloxetan-2-one decarboxylase
VSGGVEALRLFARYDEGQGPLIVLLHGINADAGDWRPVMDRIGEGYRIIAFDVLGFGESPKPSDIEYTADEHALVLENTLRDMGVREPFLLVGYSLGGDIAVRYASTYPHRLRRLFLLSAPFYLPPEAMSKAGFGQDFLHVLIFERLWKLLARSKRDDSAIFRLVTGRLEDFAKGFMRTGDVPAHWDIMSKNLVNCISAATFVDDLPRLSMPTVFALGIRDPIVQPDQTPALKRLKPDIEIRRIVGLTADHFLLVNIPERIADEIMRDEVRSLNVAWRGGKGQPLLLLHGLESSSAQWVPTAEALALHNDVAVVDLLGFGDSPAPMSLLHDGRPCGRARQDGQLAMGACRQRPHRGGGVGRADRAGGRRRVSRQRHSGRRVCATAAGPWHAARSRHRRRGPRADDGGPRSPCAVRRRRAGAGGHERRGGSAHRTSSQVAG